MIEAEQVMHRPGLHLREIKVVSQHQAIARWKPGELGWQRVARPPAGTTTRSAACANDADNRGTIVTAHG
jgi:hypothetical protein